MEFQAQTQAVRELCGGRDGLLELSPGSAYRQLRSSMRTCRTVCAGTESSPRSRFRGSIWQEAQTGFRSEPHTDQSEVAAPCPVLSVKVIQGAFQGHAWADQTAVGIGWEFRREQLRACLQAQMCILKTPSSVPV